MCVHLPVPCCGSHRRRPAPTWPCSSPPPQPPPPASGPGRSSAWLKQALQVWTGKSRVSIGRYIDHNKYRMTISRGLFGGGMSGGERSLELGWVLVLRYWDPHVAQWSKFCWKSRVLTPKLGSNIINHECHRGWKDSIQSFKNKDLSRSKNFLRTGLLH